MNMKKIATAGVMGSGLLGVAVAGIASAATVGAGNSILVEDENGQVGQCTINSVGYNSKGKAAITAGHCGKEGDKVFLKTQDGPVYIGKISHSKSIDDEGGVNSATGNDYAVIDIDETDENGEENKLTNTSSSNNIISSLVPIPNAPGWEIKGHHDDPVKPGTLVIKDGATLGRVVGVTIGSDGDSTYHVIPVAPGDSGGNVYTTDGKLVGVTSRGLPPFFLITQNNSDAVTDYKDNGGEWEYHEEPGPEHEAQSWGSFRGLPSAPEVDSAVIDVSNKVNDVVNEVNNNVPVAPQPDIVNTVSNQSNIAVNEVASQVNASTNNMFSVEVGQVSDVAHDAIGQSSDVANDVVAQVNDVVGMF